MSSPTSRPIDTTPRRPLLLAASLLLGLLPLGCQPGDVANRVDPHDPLPGLAIEILSVTGGSGPGGKFAVGDTIAVRFTAKLGNGLPVLLGQLDSGSIMVSGPTSNYQPVLHRKTNLRQASVQNPDGSYTYTFADPIPATYPPPLNDTPSFGAADGELQGLPLLDGTYTVGIEAYKYWSVGDERIRDPDNARKNFLFGGAAGIVTREVVTDANCAQCHDKLFVHGGNRVEVGQCLLCHTAGAEDKNVASAGGGTPGVTIDFKSMIHKIHNGLHLPSVNGVGTKADGSRDYAVTPKPYLVVGFGNSVHDFSEVAFPAFPNASVPMPRDFGYSALTSTEKGKEDTLRRGVTDCAACHGDPDGAGPLPAPAQGNLAYAAPTRAACGSCHDEIDWAKPYAANQAFMPPQPDNTNCAVCHRATGGPRANDIVHVHPLNNPVANPGLVFDITNISEAGANNGNGNLDPGEKLRVQFTIKDDAGADVDPAMLGRMEVVVSGPSFNRNILVEERFPTAVLSGFAHDVMVPERTFLDLAGFSTNVLETFNTSRTPIWNGTGTVWTATFPTTGGVEGNLAAAVAPVQNYIDVNNGAIFARGDYISIDDDMPGKVEYLRIQWVDGDRLWFSSTHGPYNQAATRMAHDLGARVRVVTLVQKTAGADYTLNAATGQITELVEFGVGAAVLASYTTDWVVPDLYPTALNDSPALGDAWGKWAGKSLVDGTYRIGMWGERSVSVAAQGETNNYNAVALAATADFLVGAATTIEPASFIDSGASCQSCHNDIAFHGFHRRGFDTCIMCHGTAGSEDRPRYVAPNALPTDDVSIDFRHMLHKIHMGHELTNASSYVVNGFGSGYPNNFSGHTYEHVHFPVMIGGVMNCEKCHGDGNTAWQTPSVRTHPDAAAPSQSWFVACGSCHDSAAAHAHIEVQTSMSGVESCAVCHGNGREFSVELAHTAR